MCIRDRLHQVGVRPIGQHHIGVVLPFLPEELLQPPHVQGKPDGPHLLAHLPGEVVIPPAGEDREGDLGQKALEDHPVVVVHTVHQREVQPDLPIEAEGLQNGGGRCV